jgi:glycosyltransferase involved in cell wall biosynthesis
MTSASISRSDVTISAVICAYTDARRALLDASIEAVLEQLRAGDQLVVVIDHNDDLLTRVSAEYGSRATVVPNSNDRGLSGARNAGIAASAGSVVAFIDDDARVEPGWLEQLRSDYRDPAVTAVGGNARPVWPTERPGWFPPEFDWVVGCSHKGLPVEPTPVRNLLGCNMSFRRDALEEAGGFSSEVGRLGHLGNSLMSCEETELCIRVKQNLPSATLLLDPELKVRHWVSDDRVNPRYFLRRCYWEGVSKQQLSTMVGRSDSLSTETAYVRRVLPVAFARALLAAVTSPGRRLDHLGQAAALVIGLAVTTWGYVYSLARSRFLAP